MNFNRRIKKLTIVTSFVSIILITVIITGILKVMSYNKMNSESVQLRQDYYKNQKEFIKNKIYDVYDYIEYYRTYTETRLKNEVQNRTNEAYEIALTIYENNRNKSKSEIEEQIKYAIRNIRYNNGNGYYFAARIDGSEFLFSNNPELDNINIKEIQDSNGKYVINDMLKIVETKGEGFYEYFWTKPNAEGNSHRKTSYIKYFEPLDIFIGTGLYYEDIEEIVKSELINRISQIKYKNNGYIFLTTYDGQALVFANEEYLGKSIADIEDIKGKKIHNEEMKQINKNGEGFVRYYWNKLNSEVIAEKITFVKGIDEWNWIIGTGVYIDEIEKTISLKEDLIRSETNSIIFNIIIISLVVGILIVLIKFYMLKRIEDTIKEEENLYETLTDLSEDAIFIIKSDGTIIKVNYKSHKLLGYSKEELLNLNFKELIDENSFKQIINNGSTETIISSGTTTIPVEIYTKSITLGKKINYIVYVRDLTARKIYEDALKELAITDELTQIYNRRYIMEKFNFEIDRLRRTEQPLSIAMIDIDKFKDINDSYGHIFGDEILQTFSEMFKINFRKIDYIGRYGGEEFLILLPNTKREEAYNTIDRIKGIVKNIKWHNKKISISFSCGIFEINNENNEYDLKYYIEKADKLLYKAKENGRDRIEVS